MSAQVSCGQCPEGTGAREEGRELPLSSFCLPRAPLHTQAAANSLPIPAPSLAPPCCPHCLECPGSHLRPFRHAHPYCGCLVMCILIALVGVARQAGVHRVSEDRGASQAERDLLIDI